ncbi:MAG: hypothetical protein HYY06_11475 [Deltaproteobacteria bacterium]|nr:hypothetical protein [Deltaproteobacteria bacterium]
MDFKFRGCPRSGATAVAELRRHWDRLELYIVGISSRASSNVLLRTAGANEVIQKDSLRPKLVELATRFC